MCIVVYLYAIGEVGRHWPELQAIPFIMIPAPVGLVLLEGKAALAYWAFIVLMMGLALFMTFYPERHRIIKTLKASFSGLRAPSRHNDHTIFTVGQMFMAIFFFDIVYAMLIETGGADPNVPAFEELELWENLYGFLNASVWEEIAGRVLLIGVPFLFIRVIVSIRDGTSDRYLGDMIPTLKKTLRLLWGGHGRFTPIVVGLIVFSSMMFGFAHMPGWDVYKVLPTAVSGLGFGYLYVKKGLHAAILLHFMFDYIGMALDFLPSSGGIVIAIIMIYILWILAGFVYFVFYTAKVFRFFAEPEEKWDRPATRTPSRKIWDLLGWN
jgi:hypothetical protein